MLQTLIHHETIQLHSVIFQIKLVVIGKLTIHQLLHACVGYRGIRIRMDSDELVGFCRQRRIDRRGDSDCYQSFPVQDTLDPFCNARPASLICARSTTFLDFNFSVTAITTRLILTGWKRVGCKFDWCFLCTSGSCVCVCHCGSWKRMDCWLLIQDTIYRNFNRSIQRSEDW